MKSVRLEIKCKVNLKLGVKIKCRSVTELVIWQVIRIHFTFIKINNFSQKFLRVINNLSRNNKLKKALKQSQQQRNNKSYSKN